MHSEEVRQKRGGKVSWNGEATNTTTQHNATSTSQSLLASVVDDKQNISHTFINSYLAGLEESGEAGDEFLQLVSTLLAHTAFPHT